MLEHLMKYRAFLLYNKQFNHVILDKNDVELWAFLGESFLEMLPKMKDKYDLYTYLLKSFDDMAMHIYEKNYPMGDRHGKEIYWASCMEQENMDFEQLCNVMHKDL